jgi:hypothetical protein
MPGNPKCTKCGGQGSTSTSDNHSTTCSCVRGIELRDYFDRVLPKPNGYTGVPNVSRLSGRTGDRLFIRGTWTDFVGHARRSIYEELSGKSGAIPIVRVTNDRAMRERYFREGADAQTARRMTLRGSKELSSAERLQLEELAEDYTEFVQRPWLLIVRLGFQLIRNEMVSGVVHESLYSIRMRESNGPQGVWIVLEPGDYFGPKSKERRPVHAYSEEFEAFLEQHYESVDLEEKPQGASLLV